MNVKIEDLSFSYDDSLILSNVNVVIEQGEFLGVIGPNGGGKTTFLKLLLGFLQPSVGKISVFGKSPKQSYREIAYVPQTLRFDKQFPISVLDLVLQGRLFNLPWWGRYLNEDVAIAEKSLERVGLKNFAKSAVASLSGGQMQRALIARALASQPKLLLLDEPTASVDAEAEAEIYSILRDLQGTMTIIMVTHDLRALVSEAKRILCIQREATILSPQQVCTHYALGVFHSL